MLCIRFFWNQLRCPVSYLVSIFKNQVPIREFLPLLPGDWNGNEQWTFKDTSNWLPKCPPVPASLFLDKPMGNCIVKQLEILWVPGVWQRASPWKWISQEWRCPATWLLPVGRHLSTLLKGLLLTLFYRLPLTHVLLLLILAPFKACILNLHIKRSSCHLFTLGPIFPHVSIYGGEVNGVQSVSENPQDT